MPDLTTLHDSWLLRWPAALASWSKFTRLSAPRWCFTHAEAAAEGLTSSFAMIRLADQAVVIDLQGVAEFHLEAFAQEILAHEIGHHVYAPADLSDYARMIARMRWALPGKEHLVSFIANLYTDLLVNDRLQRSANLSMAQVYETIGSRSTDRMWTLYMRMYEILWSLRTASLAAGVLDPQLEGDARLGVRLIRSYARDWLDGSGRFAALCLPYLETDDGAEIRKIMKGWRDTENAGQGGMPAGLSGVEDDESAGAIHPSLDPELSGLDAPSDLDGDPIEKPPADAPQKPSGGQARQPYQFGEILKSMGIELSPAEAAIRYYKERAAPNLIRFPARIVPESTDPQPEGLEPWDIGSPLEGADWMESVLLSPHVIPGMTTVQRVWGTTEGTLPERQPLDLDLYVDCSGSMPNPQVTISYLTLAGAIISLSALRAGARVQATLWSGKGQFQWTKGFVRDEHQVLGILTGYIGGGTQFPIHLLRDTYAARKRSDRPVHILVISDDGVTTMFSPDETGTSGWDIAATALAKARGGGTLALNIVAAWEKQYAALVQARDAGWQISPISNWEELIVFAKRFSQLQYAE